MDLSADEPEASAMSSSSYNEIRKKGRIETGGKMRVERVELTGDNKEHSAIPPRLRLFVGPSGATPQYTLRLFFLQVHG